MLWPTGIRRNERQVNLRLDRGREFDLRFFGGFSQTLQPLPVFAQVDALIAFELFDQPVDDALVKIVAAQMRITSRALHFKHAVANLENGNVKRSSSEIEHQNRFVLFLVEAVSQSCCRGLIDDAEHIETSDLTRILGRLALCIVEVSRNGDDRVLHLLAEILTGIVGQFPEDMGRDLFRRIKLAVNVYAHSVIRTGYYLVRDLLKLLSHLGMLAPHKTFDRKDSLLRVQSCLPLGDLPDDTFTCLGERNDRRCNSAALAVYDYSWAVALHHRYYGISC